MEPACQTRAPRLDARTANSVLTVIVALVGCGLAACPFPRVANEISNPALAPRIASFAKPLDDDALLSGNLLVARDGQVVHRASNGMSNHEHAIPNTADTRFCIASLTKPMTALAVARLVHRNS